MMLNIRLVVGRGRLLVITGPELLQALLVISTVLAYWRNNILLGVKFVNSLALQERALIITLLLIIRLFWGRALFTLILIVIGLVNEIRRTNTFFILFDFLINLANLIIIILVTIVFILSIHNRIFEFSVERFRHIALFFLLFIFFILCLWFLNLVLFKKYNSL